MNFLKSFFKNGNFSDNSEQNSDFPLQRYENGDRYIGEMKDGLRHGVGTYIFANGDRYEGSWKNNVKHGQGKYYYKSGELYIGKWDNNKKRGMGKYFQNNQERYFGMFQDDKKHGQGTQFHADGSWYRGQYIQGKKHGMGQLHEKNAIYEEEWDLGVLKEKKKINDITEDQHDAQGEAEETRVNQEIKQEEESQQYLKLGEKSSQKKTSNKLERKQSTCVNDIDVPNVATLEKDSDQNNQNHSDHTSNSDINNSNNSRKNPNLETQQEVSEKNQYASQSEYKPWDSMLKSIFQKNLIDSKYDSSQSNHSETIENLANLELVTKEQLMTKLVTKWTKEDVVTHLKYIGFGKYAQQFYENNITGLVLFDLNDTDLKEEFNMNLGERKLFIKSMKCLRKIQKQNMTEQDKINCENFKKCFFDENNQNNLKVKKMRSLSSHKLDRGIKMKEIEEENTSSSEEDQQSQPLIKERKNQDQNQQDQLQYQESNKHQQSSTIQQIKQRLRQQLQENNNSSNDNTSSESDLSDDKNQNQGEFLEDNLNDSSCCQSQQQINQQQQNGDNNNSILDFSDKNLDNVNHHPPHIIRSLSREHSQTKKRSLSTITVISSNHSHSYADIEEGEEDEEEEEKTQSNFNNNSGFLNTSHSQQSSEKQQVQKDYHHVGDSKPGQINNHNKILLSNREPLKIKSPMSIKLKKTSSNSNTYQSHCSHHENPEVDDGKKNKKKIIRNVNSPMKGKKSSTSRDLSPYSQNTNSPIVRSVKTRTKVLIEEIDTQVDNNNKNKEHNKDQLIFNKNLSNFTSSGSSNNSQSPKLVKSNTLHVRDSIKEDDIPNVNNSKQTTIDHVINQRKRSLQEICQQVMGQSQQQQHNNGQQQQQPQIQQKHVLFQSQVVSQDQSPTDRKQLLSNSSGSIQDQNKQQLSIYNRQDIDQNHLLHQKRHSDILSEELVSRYKSQHGKSQVSFSPTQQEQNKQDLAAQYHYYSTSSSDESSSDSDEEYHNDSLERRKDTLLMNRQLSNPTQEINQNTPHLGLSKSKSAFQKQSKYSELQIANKNQTQQELLEKEEQRQRRRKLRMDMSDEQIQTIIQKFLDREKLDTFIIDSKDLKWSSEDKIGAGGYGEVYKGIYLGQEVAVKQYGKKQTRFSQRKAFDLLSEVQVINNLRHPNIVLYMGVCINATHYLMINEYLEQGSLFDHLHIKKSGIDQDRILYIIEDIALGMAYLHGRSVLHCDLKSPNVLVDQSWNVKLCDFGLSRIRNKLKKGKRRKKNGKIGTVQWMAPEIMREEEYTNKSDVYSFGMILWELLTRKIPYYNWSHVQITGTVGYHDKFPLEVPHFGSPELIQLMKKCLHRDPEKRPPFKEIVEYIQNISKKGKSSHRKVVKDLVLFFGD